MRFDIPEKKKLLLEMTIPIRWGDMDLMGHVNNTLYFRYFEILRIEWGRRHAARPNPRGEGVVIVNTFCNFHKQLEYPGDLLGRYFVGAVGRSSFDCYMTLERLDDPGVVYAAGGAKTVWVDFPKQKSAPLPDWLRALLA
jgi:acyl-CoA thioester hydrolase